MKRKILIGFFLVGIFNSVFSQQYKVIREIKLNSSISETSGLVYISGKLWTMNDSGGKPEIYQIDTSTGNVLQIVSIQNAKNRDWESLAADEKYIYIGDTGNNKGARSRGIIYRIPIEDLKTGKFNSTVIADSISFEFSNYYYEKKAPHDFDVESIFIKNDSIYFLSKNRKSKDSFLFTISKFPGHHFAKFIGILPVKGMVTGADLNENGQLVVLSYTKDLLFCFVDVFLFKNLNFKNKIQPVFTLSFPSVEWGQTEGIAWIGNHLMVSNESLKKFSIPAKLKSIRLFTSF